MSAVTFGCHEADGVKDTDNVTKMITSLIGLMCLHKQDYYLPTSSMLAVRLLPWLSLGSFACKYFEIIRCYRGNDDSQHCCQPKASPPPRSCLIL